MCNKSSDVGHGRERTGGDYEAVIEGDIDGFSTDQGITRMHNLLYHVFTPMLTQFAYFFIINEALFLLRES